MIAFAARGSSINKELGIIVIACPACLTIQNPAQVNTGTLFKCPDCGTHLRADLFNAFLRPADPGTVGSPVQEQGQAECYNHPGRQAQAPCAQCGRLLCDLCAVDLDGRSLCFSCLKAGRDKQQIVDLETRRTLHDSIALALALVPILFIFPTVVTAPAAIYMALRYWKRPPMILPRSQWRNIAAIILAGGQIAVWAGVLIRFLS